MILHIHRHGMELSANVRSAVAARAAAALGRLEDRVVQLDIYLEDVNGGKGGVDKQCRLVAQLRPHGTLTVADEGEFVEAAVAKAADRLAQSLRREVARWRADRRPPRGPAL